MYHTGEVELQLGIGDDGGHRLDLRSGREGGRDAGAGSTDGVREGSDPLRGDSEPHHGVGLSGQRLVHGRGRLERRMGGR